MTDAAIPESRSSFRPFALGVVLMAVIVAAGAVAYYVVVARGPRITVHFNHSGHLDRGTPVVLDGREIGAVEEVDSDHGRMTVHVRLHSAEQNRVPREITFLVSAQGDKRTKTLEGHVLDPRSQPLADGDEVRGSDSALELAIRRGTGAASEIMREAQKQIEIARRELESVDWEKVDRDLRQRSESVIDELSRVANQTGDEVQRGYDTLEPLVKDVLRDLEGLKNSEEARRVKESIEKLWEKHTRRDRATPKPEREP